MDAPPAQFVRTSDGFDIAYFVAGEGPVLIRTPNLWSHVSRQWAPDILGRTFDALAARYRLVLYDARGQGLSTRGLPDSLSFDHYLLDLAAVADCVADRFILMGWSSGCATAIKFALEHPERVIGLVLWDYRGVLSQGWDSLMHLASQNWRLYVETTARVGFQEFDAYRVQEVLFDAMTKDDHVRQWSVVRTTLQDDILQGVTVPTALVASRRGSRPGSGESDAIRAASMIPGAHLTVFEGRENFWAIGVRMHPDQ